MPEETNNLSMNVKLKTGEEFLSKDISNQPFGEYDKVVTFWHKDKLRGYPLKDIEYFEFVFESEK